MLIVSYADHSFEFLPMSSFHVEPVLSLSPVNFVTLDASIETD